MASPDQPWNIVLSSEHIDWWALAAWCGINIIIPVIAPLVVLWLFSKPSTTSAMAGRNVLKSIGRGELFWAAMAMAAATCYELYSLQKILTDPNEQGLAWAAFWIHQFIILFSVIYVGIGSLSTAPAGSTNLHIPDPTVFWASIGTLIFTVLTYTVSHTVFMAQEAKLKIEADQATKKDRQAIIERIKECLAKTNGNGMHCVERLK
jgi:hypothetical protein